MICRWLYGYMALGQNPDNRWSYLVSVVLYMAFLSHPHGGRLAMAYGGMLVGRCQLQSTMGDRRMCLVKAEYFFTHFGLGVRGHELGKG